MTALAFDYIVVGGGSAGCALAARLSEDPTMSVLLLEAGGPAYRWDWRMHMPAAMTFAVRSSKLNWGYSTEPQPTLNGRRILWARGRVMGGSSSINGMAFVRGHAFDFDGWAEDPRLSHWRYAAVLPYFKRLETYDGGGDAYRGDAGPVHVHRGGGWSPLYDAFIEAGTQAGYPYTSDMNGFQQEGFGRMDMTVHRGRRVNTADAYLAPARGRRNLAIVSGAHVAKLLMDGLRCVGVAYTCGGREERVTASCEVVLAAGVIGSAQILMLSGIGPADELRSVGVTPIHDLPGVGRNLQDHLEVFVQQECRQPITLAAATRLPRRVWIGGRWILTQSGWGATNHFEAGGFIRSDAAVAWPDLQYHFLPRAVRAGPGGRRELHGYQAHLATMRSKSRGWMKLRSDRHTDHPIIEPNYLGHPDDLKEFRAGIRHTRRILGQRAFDPYRGAELNPGPEVVTDADIDAFVRAHATTGYHPCGTCKMGYGPEAVVDGHLRVHGIDGLRVADASIIPTITTGNLNAPSIMIGERAADLIRGQDLQPLDVPVYETSRSSEPGPVVPLPVL